MGRILITGMSGTGKTAIIRELAARGHRAVDLDTPGWSEWVDADASDTLTPVEGKDWVWREDRIRALLSGHDHGRLFVGGCAENMGRLLPLIERSFSTPPCSRSSWRGLRRGRPRASAAPTRSDRRFAVSSPPSSRS